MSKKHSAAGFSEPEPIRLTPEHAAWLALQELLGHVVGLSITVTPTEEGDGIESISLMAIGGVRLARSRTSAGDLSTAVQALLGTAVTKRCPTCRTVKPIEGFSIANGRADGRHWQCRVCAVIRNRGDKARQKDELAKRLGVSAEKLERYESN